MTEKAIEVLKEHGLESFVVSGILMIPIDSVDQLEETVQKVKNLLKECGYEKSWCVDPHYFERHKTITAAMYDEN